MRASTVSELLFDFVQTVFGNRVKALRRTDLNRVYEPRIWAHIAEGTPLTATAVREMPRKEQKVLYELLSQYIIFLEINRHLRFPPDFLTDSTTEQLGPELLSYIARYSWPFPQILPPGSTH